MMLIIKRKISFLLLSFCLSLAGCACVDPFEPVNREVFKFNYVVDRVILRPAACVYDTVVPSWVACRIGNFFDNIDDVTNVYNNVLQAKFLDAWSDLWRIGFNTTFGLFGLFDVATCAGLPKHHQDFGLTLARYGWVNSTYLMIPFFGPSTLRDTIAWSVDWNFLSIWPQITPASARYELYGLRLLHKRACLLAADKLIDDALDPYIFIRDAYLQKRACDIRSICPGGPEPVGSETGVAGDTFVAEGNDHVDANDTFVAEEGTKSHGKAPASGDDTFVEP